MELDSHELRGSGSERSSVRRADLGDSAEVRVVERLDLLELEAWIGRGPKKPATPAAPSRWLEGGFEPCFETEIPIAFSGIKITAVSKSR